MLLRATQPCGWLVRLLATASIPRLGYRNPGEERVRGPSQPEFRVRGSGAPADLVFELVDVRRPTREM